MADEIAQVVDLEYKGIYYLLKGTKAVIAAMVKAIKNLHNWNHKRWVNKPGNCSWKAIQEASEGMAPILEFPKEMFEPTIDITNNQSIKGEGKISPFEYYCQLNELKYCIMPDLNPDDDYIPVAVLSQDFGIHDEQIKAYMRKRVQSEEAKDKTYDEKISEAKEKLERAKTKDEKEELKKEIEALEQGKTQNSELLTESKEKMEKNNVLEFADYLKQAEGTEFLNNPELAMMQAQTCGIVREFMPEDCMYPIRDKGLVPKSGEIFYSQKAGDDELLTVKRSFAEDDKGIVYSLYEISDPLTGTKFEPVSDRGLTMEAWNEKLPLILKNAGMMKDQPMTVMKSEERFNDYVLGLDANFTIAQENGQEISNEAQIVIDQVRNDTAQREAYVRSFYSTVTVPAESVMPSENQVLSLELDDGLVEGVSLIGIDSDNAKISIRSDEKYAYIGADGKEKTLTGDEILKALEGRAKGESVTKTVSKGLAK